MAFSRALYALGRLDRILGQMRANEKLALMSHNMHLCRGAGGLSRGIDASCGSGAGKTDPPLGAWLAARYPAEVFSVWMLIGRGPRLAAFSDTLKKKFERSLEPSTQLLGEDWRPFHIANRRDGHARAAAD